MIVPADLSLEFRSDAWSPWLALMCAAALSATLVVAAWRTARITGRRRAAAIFLLRGLAALLLLLFFLQPTAVVSALDPEKTTVALLFDTSRSMGVEDGLNGRSRLWTAERLLFDTRDGLADSLGERFEVKAFAGFGEARLFTGETRDYRNDQGATRLEARGSRSDLLAQYESVVQGAGRGSLAALVWLTDGAESEPSALPERVEREGVPVFPIALGDASQDERTLRDLSVIRFEGPPIAYRGSTFELRGAVRLSGATDDERRLPRELRLLREGAPEQRRALDFREHTTAEFTLEVSADDVGLFEYQARITPPLAEDRIPENDHAELDLEVREARVTVLLLEGAMSSESGRLQHFLKNDDPDLSYTILQQKAPGRFTRQSLVEAGVEALPFTEDALAPYDVVLLGSLSPDALGEISARALRTFVSERGKGLFVFGFLDTVLAVGQEAQARQLVADLLPARLAQTWTPLQERVIPAISSGGHHAVILRGLESALNQGDLAFTGFDPVAALKPGAQALLEHPDQALRTPLLSWQRFGKGKVLLLNAGPTYPWYRPRESAAASPYHRFWGQAIRWLAGREADDAAGWTLRVEPDFVEVGHLVRVEWTPPDSEPAGHARVTVQAPDEEPRLLEASAASGAFAKAHSQSVTLRPERPGRHLVTLEAVDEDGVPHMLRRRFRAGGVERELRDPAAREDLLAQVAARSGGRLFSVLNARDLPQAVHEALRLRATQRRYTWTSTGWYLAIFIALLTAEWVLRRRWSLL